MRVYEVTSGISPSPSTYPAMRLKIEDGKSLQGGAFLSSFPYGSKLVYEGYMATTTPETPAVYTMNLQTCSAIIYCYYQGETFLGAALIHATSSFMFKDGSDRSVEGPLAEAKRGNLNVLPGQVGVVIAAGDNIFDDKTGLTLLKEARERYKCILDQCKEEEVDDSQILLYASTSGTFGIRPDGRFSEGAAPSFPPSLDLAPKKKKCYLTTAACKGAGLPDDCPELRALRWYRDNILARNASGQRDIAEYYATAPAVVACIDAHPDRHAIYAWMFTAGIQPVVAAIQHGRYDQAYRLYRAMHETLLERFAPGTVLLPRQFR